MSDRFMWAAGAVGVCVALGSPARALTPLRVALPTLPREAARTLAPSECPERTVPDHGACVHLDGTLDDGPILPSMSNAHRDRAGRWSTYDEIPRLPDRPADYDAYRYPVPPGLPGGRSVVSGFDLDRPDRAQRRGSTLSHVGHGGVDLPQAKGTPVKLVALEHQEGDAQVVYTGRLFGTTVVTRHTLREGGRLRDYLVLFGHLDAIAPGVAPGATLEDGAAIGAVGDSGSPELVHLHLEVRRVREDVDLGRVPAGPRLVSRSVSVVCDPRNVLPLR